VLQVYDYGVRLLPDVWDEAFMCVAAACVGALSCYLAYLYKLDASMRLFVITFLLVGRAIIRNDIKLYKLGCITFKFGC
jgi:hypothetical protein